MEEDKDLKPLSKDEIENKLKNFKGWEYRDNKITKSFKFRSFTDSVVFVNSLVVFCNSIDHHPDIHIFYTKITFDLTRFSVGSKVTQRDFTVAKKIEDLYELYQNTPSGLQNKT